MAKYTTETDHLFQWSQGYRLQVPKAYKDCVTQFYSEDYPNGLAVAPESYEKEGGKILCPLPNQLTVNTNSIIVYAYRLETGKAYTESKTVLSVWARPKPEDYVFVPTDVVTYQTAIELIQQMSASVASENARVEAEALRVVAEDEREEAEAIREANDSARASRWSNATATATPSDTPSVDVTIGEDGVNFEFALVKGEDGYTPVKGVDYDDGYTPIKGVDYNDGYTPRKNVDYFDGYTPQKGVDYFDGEKGDTGNGIASITLVSGTHAAGTVDTYRIIMTDGATFDFTVYNGANGEGAGDMVWNEWLNTYDPQGIGQDFYAYADSHGFSGNYNDLTNKPSIPSKLSDLTDDSTHRVVTDAEKTAWNGKADASTYASTSQYGLTKLSSSTSSTSTSLAATASAVRSAYNLANGKYSKPSGGIPSTDMTSAVQTSLGKADTALQEHQDISGKANKMTTSTFTLLASGWSGNTYNLGNTDSDLEIEIDSSATDEMLEAWSNAKMVGSATSNVLTARGDVPTIDITCIMRKVVQ